LKIVFNFKSPILSQWLRHVKSDRPSGAFVGRASSLELRL
jgi:hypothetical protein